ncbi:tRNA lysidine(34) synthetase TilS [Companilactobacillus baiquanensis]|uniref:tRNA(Ile)-lysidine synthase n=1 Tax=Companilactobacillus baiquanensis TaxID=2486005 RepID=A0ABW1USU6_9LACO|nr:tRNA lysidine(34) synthetase TilS [Companilactobacillus baiquanensis]
MRIENELVGTVKKVLQKYHSKKILIAVSGGVDSMVLLTIISKILSRNEFGVVNVDHDLRPESAQEVKFLNDFCQEHGFKFYTTKWTDHPKDVGMESAGREFRYNFFAQIMKQDGYGTLVTAHHGNDLAENILMKMIRSGNIFEVTSLKPQRNFKVGQLVRPLLKFSKADLKDYAQKKGIEYVQDETNFEDITMRNRLRNNIFPELEQENGQVLAHFGLFDQQMNALISLAIKQFQLIEQKMELNNMSGSLLPVKVLDHDQQSLFWGSFFTRKVPISISNKQINQIIDVIEGDRPNSFVDLEDNWIFQRQYDHFEIKKIESLINFKKLIEVNQPVTINGYNLVIKRVPVSEADIVVDKIPEQIMLRTRRAGDKLNIGNNHHQKLSKRFINEKVPEYKRDQSIILLFDNQIVWVEKIYNISDYFKQGNYGFKIDFR